MVESSIINIFVVANEHQIQQIDYAIENIDGMENNILFCESSIKNSPVIEEFAREKKNSIDIIYFSKWTFGDLLRFERPHKDFIKIVTTISNKGKFFKIFSSQYGSDYVLILNHILKNHNFYLLDEGTASIKVSHLRRKKYRIKNYTHLFIKSMLYGFVIRPPDKITFITDYDLKVRNCDTVLQMNHKLQYNATAGYLNEVHVIGSNLVEAKIVGEANYLRYLESIISNVKSNRVLYYSHKSENNIKFSKIKKLGYKVVEYERPYEYRFIGMAKLPAQIYSFISPVVFNIANKYQNIPELFSVNFPRHHIKRNSKLYLEILKTYSKHQRIKDFNISNEKQ